jgi:crotonobetainyl-CoA:carnitine CoA-transferase CaiB-like acyl-CoA transferase
MTGQKPFEGVTVLGLYQMVTGGFAANMLANLGADIIKIERPEHGDHLRDSDPRINGDSYYYWLVNGGKRSLELDLKSDEGKEVFYDLVTEADVVLENFTAGTADELGVGYEDVTEHNEEIVYCSITGFGEDGPWVNRRAYDLIMLGMSGIMSVTGEKDRPPVKVGVAMTDLITAMWAGFGISSALYRRQVTGKGDYIELAMFDATLTWLTKQAGKYFAGETPERLGSADPIRAPYQTYETADGYINVASYTPKFWKQLCRAIDREDLLTDERFSTNEARLENVDALEEELERTFSEKSTDEWISLLADDTGVPVGPVNSVEEALENENVDQRNLVTEVKHPTEGCLPIIRQPLNFTNADHGINRHAPRLGEHSREVLENIGYDEDLIQQLVQRGIIGETGLEHD